MTEQTRVRLSRRVWLAPVLVVGVVLLATTYGAVLDAVAYAGNRERLGPDEAVAPDLAGRATLAAAPLVYVGLVAATALGARLATAGRRRPALVAPIALVVVPVLVLLGATGVAWVALGLPPGGPAWPVVVLTAARTLTVGLGAAGLGLLLARLCGERSAPYWVASAGLWLLVSGVVLLRALNGIGETGAYDSWEEWSPSALAYAVVRETSSETSLGRYDGFGFPLALALLLALNAVAVLLAGLLTRLGGRRRTPA